MAGASRFRLALLTGLLALALAVSALLAWQAMASDRTQRRLAERALGDYADFAAFILASTLYREYGIRVLSIFSSLPAWNTPRLFTDSPPELGCGSRSLYFEFEPSNGRLRHGGGSAPAAWKRLADTLRHSETLLNEAGWRFRYVRVDLAPAADGVFIVSASVGDGFGVRGLTSCLWQDSSLVRMLRGRTALPSALTRGLPAESLYTVALTAARGLPAAGGRLAGSATLGPEFGDLAVRVALDSARAPALLIGGTASPRRGLALGLLGLSAALLLAAVAQLRRELRLLSARSEFVSQVSHELRTPLSQILIFTELLKLGRLPSEAERRRALEIVDKETRRLIRLVENVLQFSRTPAPQPLLEEVVAVAPLVRETVEAFRPLAAARDATLEIEIRDGLRVRGDRHALRQVLVNLLDNAVKYGPPGQTVRVDAVADDGLVHIGVEDQGSGVPLEARRRIWSGPARLEGHPAGSSGSGIGLSVVKTLMERMRGSARVTDAPTGGARFVVTLPAAEGDQRERTPT